MIKDYCQERDYKIHYIRMTVEKDGMRYDVGSHTEFFFLSPIDKKQFRCYNIYIRLVDKVSTPNVSILQWTWYFFKLLKRAACNAVETICSCSSVGSSSRLLSDRSRVRVPSRTPCGPLAQLVEHLAHNRTVVGSSPTRPTNMLPQSSRLKTLAFHARGRGSNPLGSTKASVQCKYVMRNTVNTWTWNINEIRLYDGF